MNKYEVIRKLSEIKSEVEKKYQVKIKGIFGSYARSEQSSVSDVDILVEFQIGAGLLDLVDLGYYLEEIIGRKVDIASERALRSALKPYIYKDLIAV